MGWIPSRPDARDLKFDVGPQIGMLNRVDLRPQCPPIFNQLDEGSCVAQSVVAAVEFERAKQKLPDVRLSRQEIYNLGRRFEGTIMSDAGMMIRTGMLIARADGIAPEVEYPYDDAKITEIPPNRVIHDGLQNKALKYLSILQDGSPIHIKNSLSLGFPVIFGFTVYDSFMSHAVAQTGDVPMPDISKEGVQGGHAVVAVGYDDAINKFIVRNSWGHWGAAGYCFMPYNFVANPNYTDDLWSIRLVQ